MMKLHYYPETDSLYIELKSSPGKEAREIVKGLVVDFDDKGEVVELVYDQNETQRHCKRIRETTAGKGR